MQIFRRDSLTKQIVQQRPWIITAIGRLLLLQSIGLFFLAWMGSPDSQLIRLQAPSLALFFALLAFFALIAGFGFLRLQDSARDRAMLVQGLSLGLSLLLYFTDRPGFLYGVMVFSIFMVLYLQHPDVVSRFGQEDNSNLLEGKS